MGIANNTNAVNKSIAETGEVLSDSSEPHVVLQVLFSLIAVMGIFGNGLLCAVMLRDHQRFLKSSYNLLIFSLAVTDMLTGVFIAVTPGFIIGLPSFPVPSGIGGELFCRLISTQYFIFVLGKVSVLTIVAMSLERWYSIVRPLAYKLNFTRKRVFIYISIIWLLSCVFNGSKPLKAQLNKSTLRCSWSGFSYPKEISIPTYTTVTFFIPIFVTWASFLHVSRALKKSLAQQIETFRNTRKKLTKMSAIVSFLLSACWFPNQVFYTLSAFDITKAETPVHHFTIVLAMLNSCMNPWVYYFTNVEYKNGFKRLSCLLSSGSNASKTCFERTLSGCNATSTDGLQLVYFRYINTGFNQETNNNYCCTERHSRI